MQIGEAVKLVDVNLQAENSKHSTAWRLDSLTVTGPPTTENSI